MSTGTVHREVNEYYKTLLDAEYNTNKKKKDNEKESNLKMEILAKKVQLGGSGLHQYLLASPTSPVGRLNLSSLSKSNRKLKSSERQKLRVAPPGAG